MDTENNSTECKPVKKLFCKPVVLRFIIKNSMGVPSELIHEDHSDPFSHK